MDLKLCEAKENYLESIADMTSEVELLRSDNLNRTYSSNSPNIIYYASKNEFAKRFLEETGPL